MAQPAENPFAEPAAPPQPAAPYPSKSDNVTPISVNDNENQPFPGQEQDIEQPVEPGFGAEPVSPGEVTKEDRLDIAFRDIALVTVASGFLIAETSRECVDSSTGCTDNMIWGLVCGCVSFVLGVIYIGVMRFGPGKRDPVKYSKTTPVTACVFLLFYTSAVGILTFDAPYIATGNGYFFCWGAFLGSGHAVYVSIDFVHNWIHHTKAVVIDVVSVERRMICGCMIMSALELTAAAVQCGKYECTEKLEYGVVMGLIGVIFCILLLALYSYVEMFLTYVSLLLALLWGVAAVILTFKGGPYNVTGNGYFASWGAFLFAASLTFLTSRHLVRAAVQRLENAIEGGQNNQMEQNPYPQPTGTAHQAQPTALPAPSSGNSQHDSCPQIPSGQSAMA